MEMPEAEIALHRDSLLGWVNQVYHLRGSEVLSRENFLHGTWDAISSLIRWQRSNPLIHALAHEERDIIPRYFTALTQLYGAYTMEPSKRSILLDCIAMLGKDFAEEELTIWSYAKTMQRGAFFPELFAIHQKVLEVYTGKHFRLSVLPPTRHLGYSILVLNHPQILRASVSPEEIFGCLSVSDSTMHEAFSIIASSQPQGGGAGEKQV